MNVTILSCFRQAVHYLERYFEQMDDLQRLLNARGDHLHLLLGYGDSRDGTGAALWDECVHRFDAHLLDVSHGGPEFGSIEHPQRFKQLASIGNKLLDNVPPDADVVAIIESDLIWDAMALLQLIDALPVLPHPAAVAPMIMDGERSFYDVFAFRRGGVRFTKQPPYHADLRGDSDLLELESAGSVLVMDAALARKARLSDEEAIVGFCAGIRKHGGSIWLDTTVPVAHPPYGGGQQHESNPRRAPERLRL